jgi:hypothetical protein
MTPVEQSIENSREVTYNLNRPASSKRFNPSRLQSQIDFKSYGQTPDVSPCRTSRRSLEPKGTIGECLRSFDHSASHDCLTIKVTEVKEGILYMAAKQKHEEFAGRTPSVRVRDTSLVE